MTDTRAWGVALLAALALAACDSSVDGAASAPGGRGATDTRQMGAPAAPDASRANPGIGLTGSFPAASASAGGTAR